MSGEQSTNHAEFRWSGSNFTYLDTPDVTACEHAVVGRYGGTVSSGAHKNEDAALVWAANDGAWVFAALLDAHGSSESADLVLDRVAECEGEVARLLNCRTATVAPPLSDLTRLMNEHLSDENFRRKCASIRGETALLLCAQKGAYLWWLSIGDIPVYVFHSDFVQMGQFALNQRMFFEWVGQVNTFALPVPCYATGVRQLRAGRNVILMATDGLLQCGTHRYENPRALYDLFGPHLGQKDVSAAAHSALETVQVEQGRDSATMITWQIEVSPFNGMMEPSA